MSDPWMQAIADLAASNRALAAAIERRGTAPPDIEAAQRAAGDDAPALPVVAAPEPQLEPPPQKRTFDDWVTDERLAKLREMIADGKNSETIARALNAMPGLSVEAHVIKRYAQRNRIKRPLSPKAAAHVVKMRKHLDAYNSRRTASNTPAPEPPAEAPAVPNPPPVTRTEIVARPARPAASGSSEPPKTVKMNATQLIKWAADRGRTIRLPVREEDVAACNAIAQRVQHPPIEFVTGHA